MTASAFSGQIIQVVQNIISRVELSLNVASSAKIKVFNGNIRVDFVLNVPTGIRKYRIELSQRTLEDEITTKIALRKAEVQILKLCGDTRKLRW